MAVMCGKPRPGCRVREHTPCIGAVASSGEFGRATRFPLGAGEISADNCTLSIPNHPLRLLPDGAPLAFRFVPRDRWGHHPTALHITDLQLHDVTHNTYSMLPFADLGTPGQPNYVGELPSPLAVGPYEVVVQGYPTGVVYTFDVVPRTSAHFRRRSSEAGPRREGRYDTHAMMRG